MFLYKPMPETIGQQLKRTRLEKDLSIEKVVQVTHIRAHAILALEADDFDSLPSATQARGFLKMYADFLGLSLDDMLARQRAGIPAEPEPALPEDAALPPVVETEGGESTPEIESPPPTAPGEQPDAVPDTQAKKPRSRKKTPKTRIESEAGAGSITVPVVHPAGAEPVPEPAEEPSAALSEPGVDLVEEIHPPIASQDIFNTIGRDLRQRRESLGLNLEEIERHTHVRRHYLEILEDGQFGQLPSSVQARGMLNNYAHFLDMDLDAVLLKFADGLQAQLAERKPVPAPDSGKRRTFKLTLPPSIRRILSPDLIVGGSVLILLVVFVIWGTGRIIRLNASTTPQPTALSISNILLSTPETGESIPSPMVGTSVGTAAAGPASTLEVELPPAGNEPVQVVLVTAHSAWVKVTADNVVEFEGRVVAGSAYAYNGNTQIEVVTGDGGALTIIYNQSNLGPMGAYGEFVDRIYTATTILIPTATYTPSPTVTLTPTITLRPTATPRPSITPRLSPTLIP
jgi:cytoskeleton protein RodZ